MSDLVGHKLAHFRIDAKLGEGGMGVVYRATDEKLRREVALKVLPEEVGDNDDRRRRFLREARSAAAATHPCIATVHEIGEADGYAFIAMELVRGTTVRDLLAQGLTVTESARIARDVARGLAKAHESGVVHRDLKPENVMVTDEGEVKILDFGIAKLNAPDSDAAPPSADGQGPRQVTAAGTLIGTAAYMSPEQARGELADARSDIFSFGTMLYEMLAGRRPFDGDVTVTLLYAVMTHEPLPLERVNPEVPPGLAAIVTRCLAKDKAARFPTARDLVDALDVFAPADRERKGPWSTPRVVASSPKLVSVTGMGTELASTMVPGRAPPPKTDSPARGTRGRSLRVPLLGVGSVLLAAAVAVAFRAPQPAASPAATPTVSAAPSADSPVSEALRVYTQANDDFAGGDAPLAMAEWKRAVTLDPTLCAAHLRIAANQDGVNVRARTEIETVRHCEASLDAHDRAFAGVVAAFIDPSVATASKVEKATHAADAFPKSRELAYYLTNYYSGDTSTPEEAIHWADRTLAADPGFVLAYARRADQLRVLGKLDESRTTLDACFAHHPDAPPCADERFDTLTHDGHCADAETYVRGLIARHPSAAYAYEMRVRWLVGTAASAEAIDRVEHQVDALRPPDAAPSEALKLRRKRQICVLHGDFDCALDAIAKEEALDGRQLDATTLWNTVHQSARIWREVGRPEEARAVVRKFFDRVAGYELDDEWVVQVAVQAYLTEYELGMVPRSKVDEVAAAALAAFPVQDPFDAWTVRYVSDDPPPDQARESVHAAPPADVVEAHHAALVDVPNRPFRIGINLLRAGSPVAARPWLEQATTACVWDWRTETTLPDLFDFQRVHAFLAVGEARERTGDKAGARAAYEEVLRRWGNAKPRSVTADAARKRLAALGH